MNVLQIDNSKILTILGCSRTQTACTSSRRFPVGTQMPMIQFGTFAITLKIRCHHLLLCIILRNYTDFLMTDCNLRQRSLASITPSTLASWYSNPPLVINQPIEMVWG